MQHWREQEDPLFRGDSVPVVAPPQPKAEPSLCRHILQIEGPGQETPYLSTTESEETATFFALPKGFIHETAVPAICEASLGHIGKNELLQLLVGKGKGKAAWHSAAEVKRAGQLVEQHAEHLIDFRQRQADEQPPLQQTVNAIFTLRSRT